MKRSDHISTLRDNGSLSEPQLCILEAFHECGMIASYHYADDSAKEWGQARIVKDAAVGLWKAFPNLHDEMREIARGFLWTLEQP